MLTTDDVREMVITQILYTQYHIWNIFGIYWILLNLRTVQFTLTSQRVFHFGSNLQKKVPSHNPEHLLFTRWIALRILIWHFFLKIWAKVKNFLRSRLRFSEIIFQIFHSSEKLTQKKKLSNFANFNFLNDKNLQLSKKIIVLIIFVIQELKFWKTAQHFCISCSGERKTWGNERNLFFRKSGPPPLPKSHP